MLPNHYNILLVVLMKTLYAVGFSNRVTDHLARTASIDTHRTHIFSFWRGISLLGDDELASESGYEISLGTALLPAAVFPSTGSVWRTALPA
jgi:hypothetical protein